ncbi:MAG: hypothetical protein KF718_05595 [Polyangiaceae bacterium]|nr:hypothetical protein [Polyangiaceae bacterium]
MRFATLSALFATCSLLGASSGARTVDPPSSLEPSAERGEVSLSHSHKRVRACAPAAEGKPCQPELEDGSASARVRFVPVKAKIYGDDKRDTVDVSIAAKGGAQTVTLAGGTWDADWVEAGRKARLRIAGGDKHAVRLETRTGECQRQRSKCVLATEPVVRRLDVRPLP